MTADVELKGVETAIRRQVGKRLHQTVYKEGSFIGLLLALDTFYNRGAKASFQREKVEGGKMQLDFITGLPVVRGTNAKNPDYRQRYIPLEKGFQNIAGTIEASSYEGAEPIDKWDRNRFKDDKHLANYVSVVSDAFTTAIVKKLEEDILPATNQVGGTGNNRQQDRIMALQYPLQSGYANNALAGSGSYPYLGIDLNVQTGLKSINAGTTSQSIAPSISNIRKKILMPLRARGANPDIILANANDFNYIVDQGDLKVQFGHSETLKYGGTYAQIEGIWVVYEPRLDLLPVPELLVLDSSTWFFGTLPGAMKDLDFIEKVPGAPSFSIIQWYSEFVFGCGNPRYNGRLYNTAVP